MVVIKDAQRFDYVGDRDPAVADEKQVFPVLLVRRRGEVVKTEVEASSRFVEVDDNELVVHAVATASRGLRLEGLRDVEAHPRQGLLGFGMSGDEGQSIVRFTTNSSPSLAMVHVAKPSPAYGRVSHG